MAGSSRDQRSSNSSLLDSPSLDAKLIAGGGRNLLDEGDDSGFMNLTGRDLDKMNLVDTPPVRRIEKKSQAHLSSPSKSSLTKRPSWGPKSSPVKGKMRLLEGVKDAGSTSQASQVRRKERTLGGFGQEIGSSLRPRQSIFVKPTFTQTRREEAQEKLGNAEKEDEGEDSFYKDPALSSSTSSIVKGRVAAIEASRAQAEAANQVPNISGTESREQMEIQLSELKKMNGVFEAYERMLTGSADQIENFAQRIEETNSLLDIYIDLMRQADRTQQLLLDTNWKGATEDETAHNLALELAEREKRRKEEEEEQQMIREAARRKQEEEKVKSEAQQAEKRRLAGTSSRGARSVGVDGGAVRGSISSARGRGAASATSRVPTATRGKTVSAASSSRGATAASRGGNAGSTTNGLNNQYAGVRSSGYGPSR